MIKQGFQHDKTEGKTLNGIWCIYLIKALEN